MTEEDDIVGGVPVKVKNITLHFPALHQEEIVRISQNKFKPINHYPLRHMRGLQFNAFQDLEMIDIKDGILRLRKTS